MTDEVEYEIVLSEGELQQLRQGPEVKRAVQGAIEADVWLAEGVAPAVLTRLAQERLARADERARREAAQAAPDDEVEVVGVVSREDIRQLLAESRIADDLLDFENVIGYGQREFPSTS